MSINVTMAKKVCAWCRSDMGMIPWASTSHEAQVTHGICAACESKQNLPDEGMVKLTIFKKDGMSLSVTTHWFQALLRLDFACTLAEYKDFAIGAAE